MARVHETGPRCWRYRAYNDQYKVVEGIARANSFPELALHLRQTMFLCIISAETIDEGTYKAEIKLQKMHQSSG